MNSRTFMLHVRVDDRLKTEAAERLSNVGLTISDAVRILLTRVAKEGGSARRSLAVDPDAYDAWFRAKVQEALADSRPGDAASEVMDEALALIDKKRRPGPVLEWRQAARDDLLAGPHPAASHGFTSGTPIGAKSARLRVTIVMPCTNAVAAMKASRSGRGIRNMKGCAPERHSQIDGQGPIRKFR